MNSYSNDDYDFEPVTLRTQSTIQSKAGSVARTDDVTSVVVIWKGLNGGSRNSSLNWL